MRWRFLLALVPALALGQPKEVLFLTHSAGFRHSSIETAVQVLRQLAASSQQFNVTATEDVSTISEAGLRNYDAVFFFTSGELPVSDAQKAALLQFVRGGKGFGGVHSATDTFYQWPEYGELIGARFNGHPWVHEVGIDVEDAAHPAASHAPFGFSILEEIYQFREFSRDRVRVLMSLDTSTVNLRLPDVNPGTADFPLAWCRSYGSGRVFYNALGHFESTWLDRGFQQSMLGAILWLTGQSPGDAGPRASVPPAVAPEGAGNAASLMPRMTLSPGSLISIFGRGLTTGSSQAAEARSPRNKLSGTTLRANGLALPLLYVSPGQINALLPLEAKPADCAAGATGCRGPRFDLEIATPSGTATVVTQAAELTPGVFAVTRGEGYATVWSTGLGAVTLSGDLFITRVQPTATLNGQAARVLFSGLAPGWLGLYQVNVELPVGLALPATLELDIGGIRLPVRLSN